MFVFMKEKLTSETTLELSTEFLAVVVCPMCRTKFTINYERLELVCTSAACGLVYPVEDRIPVLPIDQTRNTQ